MKIGSGVPLDLLLKVLPATSTVDDLIIHLKPSEISQTLRQSSAPLDASSTPRLAARSPSPSLTLNAQLSAVISDVTAPQLQILDEAVDREIAARRVVGRYDIQQPGGAEYSEERVLAPTGFNPTYPTVSNPAALAYVSSSFMKTSWSSSYTAVVPAQAPPSERRDATKPSEQDNTRSAGHIAGKLLLLAIAGLTMLICVGLYGF